MSTKYQLTAPHQNLQIWAFLDTQNLQKSPKPESLWSLLILVGATCPVSYVPTNTALRQSTTDNRDQQLQSAVDKNRNQQSEEAVKNNKQPAEWFPPSEWDFISTWAECVLLDLF